MKSITVGMLHERDHRTPGSRRWHITEDADEAVRIVGMSEAACEP